MHASFLAALSSLESRCRNPSARARRSWRFTFGAVEAGQAGMNRAPVRIITPRGRSNEAGAAKDLTAQLLPQLEEYTGIPYPFGKLDHLALLEGPFGATEYPGLITYQQRILLA